MAHRFIVIASFLTTIKSSWELLRMVRKKVATKILKAEAQSTLVLLQQPYHKKLFLESEFDLLFKRLMRAEAHNGRRYAHRASWQRRARLLVVALRKVSTSF